MDQLLGRIAQVNAEDGVQPRLRFQVIINSKNLKVFDVIGVTARSHFAFSDGGRTEGYGLGGYIGAAYTDYYSQNLVPGDANSRTFFVDVPLHSLAIIEETRANKDILLQLSISLVCAERKTDMTPGPISVATVNDANSQGNSYFGIEIAKSKWQELLPQMGFKPGVENPLELLQKSVEAAQQYRKQAEEAANAAKLAVNLTAVANLAGAYDEEARQFAKNSKIWLGMSLIVVAFAISMIQYFLRHGFLSKELALSEAIFRAVVLGIIFGAFSQCMRIYEAYKHLEVVNRHRVNIGRTFEAFKDAQPTERAKEVMAAITAENMLAFGRSGLLAKDNSVQTPFSGISELVKTILEKKASTE